MNKNKDTKSTEKQQIDLMKNKEQTGNPIDKNMKKDEEVTVTISKEELKQELVKELKEDIQSKTDEMSAEEKSSEEEEPSTDAMRLIRCKITCNNPVKNDLRGEIFRVSNSKVQVARFVPYGSDKAWHIEEIIYNSLKEKQYQTFIIKKVPGKKIERKVPVMRPEFSIEVLPDLTPKELEALKQQQANVYYADSDEEAEE
jgi:hypothetical protein